MKHTSFTERVLVAGALGASLIAASLSVLVIGSTAAALGGWQNWLQLKALGPLFQIATALLMLLGAAALDLAVWQRIVRRRRAFQEAHMPGFRSLTPRGKYAAWGLVRPHRGNPASGALRTRKKVGR